MGMFGSQRRRQIWAQLIKRDAVDGKIFCCWCSGEVVRRPGASLRPDTATIEHVRPRKEGGGSAIDNLAIACGRCNMRRDGQSPWTHNAVPRS